MDQNDKCQLLQQLDELEKLGHIPNKKFTLADDLAEIIAEKNRLTHEREVTIAAKLIQFFRTGWGELS